MATTIVDQIIEYDNSAQAWAQMQRAGLAVDLVKYHDSEEAAILAALPDDLREWVQTHSGSNGAPAINERYLRAACYLVEGRIKPDPQAFGIYHARGDSGAYVINCSTRACTCPDRQASNYCKHLIGANRLFNAYLAENSSTLYALALQMLSEKSAWLEHERIQLWASGRGDRYAMLYCLRDYIYLHVSGHRAELRLAQVTKHSLIMVADYYAYLAFVQELKS